MLVSREGDERAEADRKKEKKKKGKQALRAKISFVCFFRCNEE